MRIRGIKGRLEEREERGGDFFGTLGNPEKKKGGDQREGREKRKRRESKTQAKTTPFFIKEGDLAFQRVLTLKSSLRVKLGAH